MVKRKVVMKKEKVIYDLIYSDVDRCHIAIPHFNQESVKQHHDRINIGTSGLSGSMKVKSKDVVELLKKYENTINRTVG
jgi:hypothetical protein